MSTIFCEQVLFIDVSEHKSVPCRQFDLACAFCGLSIKRLFMEDSIVSQFFGYF